MPQVIETPPDSKVFTVQELYAKSSPLLVPSWQRDYSWQPDEHVQKLIDDLWEYIEGAEVNPGRYYLLGQVILVPNSDQQNEIVDGQQRLTTVYLLLLCLLNTFKIDGRVALNVQKNSVIYSMLINSVVDDEDNIRLLLPYQDGSRILKHLYGHGANNRDVLGSDLTNSQKNLLDVYDHITSWVEGQLVDEESLTLYTRRVLQLVYFTRLIINDIPQAMDYFEKMNRRGLPLAASDLLKNYLFSQTEADDFESISHSWRKMSSEVEKIKKKSIASVEMFIKSLAVSRHFQKLNGTEALLKYWKEELTTPAKRDEFVGNLVTRGKFYRDVANGKMEDSPDSILENVRNLNGSQHLPVLMAGRDLLHYRYLCDLVDRRFTLYTFANERTGAFESMIPKWCKELCELPKNASEKSILAASRSAEGFLRPDAEVAITTFIEGLNYQKGSNRRKLRFVLALVAKYFDMQAKAEHHSQPLSFYLKTARKSSPGFDMDHVLGQQYLNTMSADQKKIFHSIGALTPLFSSAHLEDVHLKPHEKVNLYGQSPFVLTKSLIPVPSNATPRLRTVLENLREMAPVDLAVWNEEAVAKRTALIISGFLSAISVKDFLSTQST